MTDHRVHRWGVRMASLLGAIGMAWFVFGCHGGSGQIETDISVLLPVAMIETEVDDTVIPARIIMDGSASHPVDGEVITNFVWEQTGGTAVELTYESEMRVRFEVPNTTDELVFTLTVTDDDDRVSLPARVEILIVNGVVLSIITPPEVDPTAGFEAVVVSTAGSDAVDRRGTWLDPVASIARAITLAGGRGFTTIYIMNGRYAQGVALADGLTLVGGVDSFTDTGEPVLGEIDTTLAAPEGSACAVQGQSVSNVTLQRMRFEGGDVGNAPCGLRLSNAHAVVIEDVRFVTDGRSGASCVDLIVEDSADVAVRGAQFANSGRCERYAAVGVMGSTNVTVGSASRVAFAPDGAERLLQGVGISGGSDVIVDDLTVSGGGDLGNAVVAAVQVTDAQGVTLSNVDMETNGGSVAKGISITCDAAAAGVALADSRFILQGVAEAGTGVQVTCPQPNAIIDVQRNRFAITARASADAKLSGVDVAAQLRPIDLSIVNNVIAMEQVADDQAHKTGVSFSALGNASSAHIYNNSIFLAGGSGNLHGVRYDRNNPFGLEVVGTIGAFYGNNPNSAFFSLHSTCVDCFPVLRNNAFNATSSGHGMPLIHRFDTDARETMGVVNECTDGTPPPAGCADGSIQHEGNVLATFALSDIDLGAGVLLEAVRGQVRDLGLVVEGVTTDVNGAARDATPDIGATEYN